MNDLTANDVKWAKQHDWYVGTRTLSGGDVAVLIVRNEMDWSRVVELSSKKALHDYAGY